MNGSFDSADAALAAVKALATDNGLMSLDAFAYALLESLVPGSFTIGGEPTPADARFDRYIGFSFTTLTTLGYGTIVPTNPRADALTSLQAIAGPVYLTIVIARLVAIQVGQQEQASDQTQR